VIARHADARIRQRGTPSIPPGQCQPIYGRRSGVGRFNIRLESQLKRGEIWTGADDGQTASKPRPVVIIRNEHFEALESVTICGFTSDPTDLPLFRVLIEPSKLNGLQFPSRIMVDKILTMRKNRLGYRIGRLENKDVGRLDQAIATFLGLAD
jgi:mRNA interferase MazF